MNGKLADKKIQHEKKQSRKEEVFSSTVRNATRKILIRNWRESVIQQPGPGPVPETAGRTLSFLPLLQSYTVDLNDIEMHGRIDTTKLFHSFSGKMKLFNIERNTFHLLSRQ